MNDLNDFWVAVDLNGAEWMFMDRPVRNDGVWFSSTGIGNCFEFNEGTIESITGHPMTWNDEPVEVKLDLKK